MTKKAVISTAELKRLAQIVNEEGVTLEVTRDGVTVRVMPFHPSQTVKSAPEQESPESALARWRAQQERREKTGKGGYQVIDDPRHPLKQWYDKLGFDPETMNEADMRRLMKENHDRWKASIPGTKIGKREMRALEQLSKHGVGVHVKQNDISGCGEDTLDRLEARGFVGYKELLPAEKLSQGFTLKEIWLLEPGLEAVTRTP